MSIVRNRELSQFGSFIYVDNSNQEIGITTETLPFIGIGTANPQVKLDVLGDTNVTGNLTVTNNIEASSFTLNGAPLVNASVEYWLLSTDTLNLYRATGNVGIGTSVFTAKLTVDGNVSADQLVSTITGSAPLVVASNTQVTNLNASFLAGKSAPSGVIVGTTDTQTLSNKTLSSPTINTPSITSPTVSETGITFLGSSSGNTVLRASASATGFITLPSATDTLVARNTTDTLTNKTISASSNTISGLTNSNLSGSAGITNANLDNSTISGVSLGSNLNSLTFGSFLTSAGSYNGSTARTVSVAATTAKTGGTVVARNSTGGFSAGDIGCDNLTATFDVTANAFVKPGGTDAQFLKADGSVDPTPYVSAGKAIAMSMVFS